MISGGYAGDVGRKRAVRLLAATMLLGVSVLNTVWMGMNTDAQYWLDHGSSDEIASIQPSPILNKTTKLFGTKSDRGSSKMLDNIVSAGESSSTPISTISFEHDSITIPAPAVSSTNQSFVRDGRHESTATDLSFLNASQSAVDHLNIEGLVRHHQPLNVSVVPTTEVILRGNQSLSLLDLTRSPPIGSVECPSSFMVPVYDRIVEPTINDSDSNQPLRDRKIPRIIHVSFNRRCIPQELAVSVEKWHQALPDHSLYFHDDDAVDRLLNLEWPEFPGLHRLLACVKFKGAMKIDIWRILVLYKYGGIYTDIDNWPRHNFTTETIQPYDTFFSLSDAYDRPSQWLFAMEPGHPIGSLAVWEIIKRLKRMKNIAQPRVVQITGPQTLKRAYLNFLLSGTSTIDERTNVRKIPQLESGNYAAGSLGGTFDDIVEFQGVNMTIREKTELISGIVHWPKQVKINNLPFQGSCVDYLALLDSQNPNWMTQMT
jgi:hypothetical protein